jgi:putative peptidoglycan lipid II flippase
VGNGRVNSSGEGRGRPAARVAAGILVTRLLGLIRERVFAHYFGSGQEADAFRAALRIPNIIRNLLGEGTLSASFIPVYASMLQRDEEEAARQLSSVVASLLVVVAVVGSAAGVVLAPLVTDAVALGFDEATRTLTIGLVRILFPMAGVMILSAWCLGVLNTHRRFFLSYAAPTLWNIAQIVTLVVFGSWVAGWRGTQLVTALAWGALVGSVLQVLVQLPTSIRVVGALRWTLQLQARGVQTVLRAWFPVVIGAGVWQISSLIDTQLGSFTGSGGVAFLGYAQLLAILPVSLFGISIAAAALPELSRDAAAVSAEATRDRLADGARRVAFFVIPSAFVFAALGSHVVGALYQTGSFGATQTEVVTGVLAAYAVGLPAQGSVRLLTSGHYALGDTRTPLMVAVVTVVLAATLAVALMQPLGVAGIALGSATAAYVNLSLNYAFLQRRTGRIMGVLERASIVMTLGASLIATGAALVIQRFVPADRVLLGAVAVLGTFGLVYMAVTILLKHPDARQMLPRGPRDA